MEGVRTFVIDLCSIYVTYYNIKVTYCYNIYYCPNFNQLSTFMIFKKNELNYRLCKSNFKEISINNICEKALS